MTPGLNIASVCRSLPHAGDSSSGVFVARRLEAMAKQSRLSVIQPVPWFPVVAGLPEWARDGMRSVNGMEIASAPMFYIPKFLKRLDGYWLYRSVAARLERLKRAGQLDLIDAHFGYPEGVGCLRAARELGVPLFVTLRGFEAEYLHIPGIGGQIRRLLTDSDGIICVSHFLRELAMQHGADESKIAVIHNAIDRSVFRPGSRAEARRRLNLDQDQTLVISVGHLVRRKRHHVLVQAFARFAAARLDARLLVIGNDAAEPDYARHVTEQVVRHGLEEKVTLLGNVDASRIVDYLQAADYFVLGTQREGCCNAILEALACQ